MSQNQKKISRLLHNRHENKRKRQHYRCSNCNLKFTNSWDLVGHTRWLCGMPSESVKQKAETEHWPESQDLILEQAQDQILCAEEISYPNYCNNALLSLQRRIIYRTTVGSVSPIVVNQVYNALNNRREQSDWIDYIDIYNMIHECALSEAEADVVIKTISRMLLRKDMHVSLPRSSKVIKKAITTAALQDFNYKRYIYNVPRDVFKPEFRNVNTAVGHYVTVMEIFAEMMIEIPLQYFHLRPYDLRTDMGEKLFREPATGHCCVVVLYQHIYCGERHLTY